MITSLVIWWLSFFFSIGTVTLHALALTWAKGFFVEHHHRKTTLKIAHYIAYAVWLHWLEIMLFGILFWALSQNTSLGIIHGAQEFHDYMYFSSTTYTSLGFGDLYPTGHLRILVGTEALIGLIMISWSAAFAVRVARHDA